ncbi:mucin-2 [Episyrphus balteatus]|uniref:mucin-2 n=1 Tax=Episyrphus balteatus TaxID=286459 RepID=UPI0024864B9D|nr:mucin-2 [Episyrphus balteatus]
MIPNQYKILLLWLRFLTIVISGVKGDDHVDNFPPEGFEGRLMNPKLDRNGWKPLGQGDPLKNDPTFDYSPPALERVRYWAENNKTKDDSGSKRNKSDILLLGVPSKRENMKKEQKYTSIRRSYYGGGGGGGNLPTRLMPPPMQTLQPQRMKTTTTEMHHYQTQYPSTKSYFSSSGSGSGSGPGGSYRTKSPYDTKYAESNNYVSFTRPDTKYSNIRIGPNDFIGMQSPRKPWVHELLQKELIKPKPSPAKPIQTTSMKSVFETHRPEVFITTTSTPVYNPPTTMPFVPTTTTSQKPVYPSYMAPAAYDTFYPTIAPIDITTEEPPPVKQTMNGHFEVSMYQIIEGHSKVKTYGQSDNDTSTHEPKIVPITPRQESVVRHVTSSDDLRFTHQVKHLHTKKSTTTTTTTSTTTTTTAKPYTMNMPKDEVSTRPPSAPAQQKAPMQGLLSLLDSSLGNFFIDEPTGDEMGTLFSGPALDDTEPTIFVTTTTSYPPTAIELGSPRSSRQIFDYDQLPESRLKDLNGEEIDDESDIVPKNWLRSSVSEVKAEEGEQKLETD